MTCSAAGHEERTTALVARPRGETLPRSVYLSLPQKSNTASHDSGPYPIETKTPANQTNRSLPLGQVAAGREIRSLPPRLSRVSDVIGSLIYPSSQVEIHKFRGARFPKESSSRLWAPGEAKGERGNGAKPCEGVWERKSLRLVSPELRDQDLHRTRI